MHFVDVILPLSLAKTFTYSVSEAEFHFIKIEELKNEELKVDQRIFDLKD